MLMSLIRTMKEERPDDYEALMKKTGLKEEELEFWNTVQSKIYLPRKEGTNLLEQFEGYFQLKDVVIDQYDENDWPIRPEALKTCKPGDPDFETAGCCAFTSPAGRRI